MSKLPWLKFFPTDWLSDAVAGCSPAAKGIWIDLLCAMHLSQHYGYLEADGKPVPDEMMFRRCGCSTVEEYRNLLAELFAAGVPSRTPDGVIYNRRMVRDQEKRQGATERQRKHRSHAPVTRMSQEEVRSQKLEARSQIEEKGAAQAAPSLSFAGQHFSVTTKQDAMLGEAFPWVDRPAEYRKADSWMEANPGKQPKKANRFLHNWFSRITQPKEGSNGKKLTGSALTEANLRAAGFPVQ